MTPTTFKQVKNNAYAHASPGVLNNLTNPLTFAIGAGEGARFPVTGNSFWATIWNDTAYEVPEQDPNMEIVLVTARATDNLTVTRGQLGTSVNAHAGSPAVELFIVDQHFLDVYAAINNIESGVTTLTNYLSKGGDYATGLMKFLYGATISGALTLSGTAALNIGNGLDATGDIFYRDENGLLARLVTTISGQSLVSGGPGKPPLYMTISGGSGGGGSAASQNEVNTGTDNTKFVTPLTLTSRVKDNAPQGFLLNGKIAVSVSSNNLTVAIKGLDGNDPSATNPVYCRIGDTVRAITAALSVTKNAGTNWFNSGSSELATKEIDYFVYLGYNATDGVVIGFARVPFGTRYDSFSTTSTNDNYCAISTITTAAAGDYYELIGRFAATLSAGSGYTWTVPTYTALNLIQRPIFQTRWLEWLPTYSSNGSMTYGSVTGTTIYRLDRDVCHFIILVAGTTANTTTTGISATLPITSFALDQPGASSYYDAGGGAGFFTINTPWNIIVMYKQAEANWGIGSNRQVKGNNLYRIK